MGVSRIDQVVFSFENNLIPYLSGRLTNFDEIRFNMTKVNNKTNVLNLNKNEKMYVISISN